VVLGGLEGVIEVGGNSFDGEMPSFDFLTDDEIAAVVGYVRSNFGNAALRPEAMADVTAADVAALRAVMLTPADAYAYRQSLK
jgi:mono/diheme cytochrome c family protein